jgi:hypothetical protein
MTFLKRFLINLAFLIGLGIILTIISPNIMKQVFQLFGGLFGPLALLFVVIAALPRKRRSKD